MQSCLLLLCYIFNKRNIVIFNVFVEEEQIGVLQFILFMFNYILVYFLAILKRMLTFYPETTWFSFSSCHGMFNRNISEFTERFRKL